jgi:hypothetical protein
LFLVQARADYEVFALLRGRSDLPICHALHYLQMATEMLGKAHAWEHGPPGNTHRAFVGFLRSLRSNRDAQGQFGFHGQNENWRHVIRRSIPLVEAIEDLAPALTPDGPNAEYPWPRAAPHTAPAEYSFAIWRELRKTAMGLQFLDLTERLFAVAERFL